MGKKVKLKRLRHCKESAAAVTLKGIKIYNCIIMKLVKVKTLHIFNNNCDVLRTIKVVTIFGMTIFTKTIAHLQDM